MIPCYGNLVVLRELSTQLHRVSEPQLIHQFRDVCTVFHVMREMMQKTGANRLLVGTLKPPISVPGMIDAARDVFEDCSEAEALYQGNILHASMHLPWTHQLGDG